MESVAQPPLYMTVSPVILENTELGVLREIADYHLERLLTPKALPEYTKREVLRSLHKRFGEMIDEGRLAVLFMTKPDVIALDEAIEDFTRVFECSAVPKRTKRAMLKCFKQSREELAEMKLALTICEQHDAETCGVTEHMGRKCYCMQIRREPVGECQQVFQHCTTVWPGMLEWLQDNVEWGP